MSEGSRAEVSKEVHMLLSHGVSTMNTVDCKVSVKSILMRLMPLL